MLHKLNDSDLIDLIEFVLCECSGDLNKTKSCIRSEYGWSYKMSHLWNTLFGNNK